MCTCPPGGTDHAEADKAGCTTGKPPTRVENVATISRVIRSEFPRFRACYQSALERHVKLAGRVAVSFELTPDGDVFRARVADATVGDLTFQTCLLDRFRALRFPPPFRGVAAGTYPLEFDNAE